MSFFPHRFHGPLPRFGVGRTRKDWYTALFLPAELERVLPFDEHPRLRVGGEIGEDAPVSGAWMPTGDGRRYFIVARRVMTQLRVALGDHVEMRFRIADQDAWWSRRSWRPPSRSTARPVQREPRSHRARVGDMRTASRRPSDPRRARPAWPTCSPSWRPCPDDRVRIPASAAEAKKSRP